MKIPALVMYYFGRVREGGDVPKRVNARDENEINNTGFGVNRYRCVHTPVAVRTRSTHGSHEYDSTKFSSSTSLHATRSRESTAGTRPRVILCDLWPLFRYLH